MTQPGNTLKAEPSHLVMFWIIRLDWVLWRTWLPTEDTSFRGWSRLSLCYVVQLGQRCLERLLDQIESYTHIHIHIFVCRERLHIQYVLYFVYLLIKKKKETQNQTVSQLRFMNEIYFQSKFLCIHSLNKYRTDPYKYSFIPTLISG